MSFLEDRSIGHEGSRPTIETSVAGDEGYSGLLTPIFTNSEMNKGPDTSHVRKERAKRAAEWSNSLKLQVFEGREHRGKMSLQQGESVRYRETRSSGASVDTRDLIFDPESFKMYKSIKQKQELNSLKKKRPRAPLKADVEEDIILKKQGIKGKFKNVSRGTKLLENDKKVKTTLLRFMDDQNNNVVAFELSKKEREVPGSETGSFTISSEHSGFWDKPGSDSVSLRTESMEREDSDVQSVENNNFVELRNQTMALIKPKVNNVGAKTTAVKTSYANKQSLPTSTTDWQLKNMSSFFPMKRAPPASTAPSSTLTTTKSSSNDSDWWKVKLRQRFVETSNLLDKLAIQRESFAKEFETKFRKRSSKESSLKLKKGSSLARPIPFSFTRPSTDNGEVSYNEQNNSSPFDNNLNTLDDTLRTDDDITMEIEKPPPLSKVKGPFKSSNFGKAQDSHENPTNDDMLTKKDDEGNSTSLKKSTDESPTITEQSAAKRNVRIDVDEKLPSVDVLFSNLRIASPKRQKGQKKTTNVETPKKATSNHFLNHLSNVNSVKKVLAEKFGMDSDADGTMEAIKQIGRERTARKNRKEKVKNRARYKRYRDDVDRAERIHGAPSKPNRERKKIEQAKVSLDLKKWLVDVQGHHFTSTGVKRKSSSLFA